VPLARFSKILLASSAALLLAPTVAPDLALEAADCNQNGVEDSTDVRTGTAPDCNQNGRPDSCDLVPAEGVLDLSSAVPTAIPGASSLVLADVSGDGHLDAIVGHERSAEIQIHLGGPSGFAPASLSMAVEPGRFISAFSATDLTGDGLADVALISRGIGDQVLDLYRSTGDGFAAAEPLPGPGQSTFALLTEDLDQDGSREIIEASYTEVRIHWNGAGAFGEPTVLSHNLSSYSLVALDVDGDGDLDLLAAANHSTFALLFQNQAQRSFLPPARHDLPVPAERLVAGELNGARGSDLLILAVNGDLALLTFEAGEFKVFRRLRPRDPTTDILATELDGDGIADAVVFHPGSPCGTEASWIEVRRASDDLSSHARSTSVPGRRGTGVRLRPRCAKARQ
jgi:hypothetical protein